MLKNLFLSAVASLWLLPSGVKAETYSWGLPGSSQTSFEKLSRECALNVARRDVKEDKPTKKFLRGFEALERENNMPPMPGLGAEDSGERGRRQVLIRKAYSTEKHIDMLQQNLQNELDVCLINAGYIRFVLSDEQEKQLKKLKPGSENRRQYLYELGSNRDIVMSQKMAE